MHNEVALCIDRNQRRQGQIKRALYSLGFKVYNVSTIQLAKEIMKENYCDLTLIYLGTMANEVLNFCTFVRSGFTHSIIIILMDEVSISFEERLFDCGVNDVIVRRQSYTRVLKKRIKAHFFNCKQLWHQGNKIRLKDTIIDFDRREVWHNGTIHTLPGILNDLLKYFIDNPNRIISRKELLESSIWADSICTPAEEGGKTFDVNVGKLRKIIEPDPSNPQIIISVRGVGWKLAHNLIR